MVPPGFRGSHRIMQPPCGVVWITKTNFDEKYTPIGHAYIEGHFERLLRSISFKNTPRMRLIRPIEEWDDLSKHYY